MGRTAKAFLEKIRVHVRPDNNAFAGALHPGLLLSSHQRTIAMANTGFQFLQTMFLTGFRCVFIVLPFLLWLGHENASSRSSDSGTDWVINVESIPSPTFGKVNAILRDRRGFLWFATTNGLDKFDGYEVYVSRIASGKHDFQRFITAILQDGDSSLLMATRKGLWTFNLCTETFAPFMETEHFGDDVIEALVEDETGVLWIGTRTGGLFRYDRRSGEKRSFTRDDGLSDNRVTRLLLDRSGVVWIGTHDGLNALNRLTGRIDVYRSNPADTSTLSSDEIWALDEDANGGLWVGTFNGLNLLHRNTGRVQRFLPVRGAVSEALAITHDPSGRVWCAMSGVGLFVYTNGELSQVFPSSRSLERLSDLHINTLYTDPTSSGKDILLWIGSRRGGVDKLLMKRNPFSNFIRQQNLPVKGFGAVLSMVEDRRGVLWVGLWGGGLNALQWKDGEYSLVDHYVNDPTNPSSLPDNTVNTLLEDRSGILWVGTGSCLAALRQDRKGFLVYKHRAGDSTSIVAGTVSNLFEDRKGRVWVCADSGLSEVAQSGTVHFKNYLFQPEDAHTHGRTIGGNVVSSIVEDDAGNLWASMYGGGLNLLEDDGSYTRFLFPGDSDRTQESWVYGISRDRHGTFWLSTAAGVVRFDPVAHAFSRLEADELGDAHIFDIVGDKKGMEWFSTGIGLVRLDPETRTFTRFGDRENFPFKELISKFCRVQGGKLLVGGLDGFTAFNPDSISNTCLAPPIVITGFSIFDKPQEAAIFGSPKITLSYDENSFSFSFAALDYTDSKRNSYAYRMVGLDPTWVNSGHRNYASYTNIDPGEYTFNVKGANSDGIWNEAGTSMKVIITPPYWHSWWFRIMAALLLTTAAYGAYRYRLRHLLSLERLRLRIAHDLHDDLGSNLSAIAMASKSAQGTPGLKIAARKKLGEIYEMALTTSEGMKDLVWFIKPETDKLENLILRMKETALSLLGDVDIDFQISKPMTTEVISVDFKRTVFLAFKEAINNIMKHAQATKVDVLLTAQDGMLEMIICDNGMGFDRTTEHHGTGLHSLRKRAQMAGGSCTIVSEPGLGTTVKFSAEIS